MRWIWILLLVGSLLIVSPAQAQSTCQGGAWTTEDLAGAYISQPSRMALLIEPCGTLVLTWDNAYGRHQAVYQATERFPAGGVLAIGIGPDQWGWYLDGQTAIGVSPAEPGFIRILTLSPYGTDPRQYRLEKAR